MRKELRLKHVAHAIALTVVGGTVTLAIGELVGLNSWLLRRVTWTWNIPGYRIAFPIVLTLGSFAVFWFVRRGRWKSLAAISLGLAVGYLAGVVSYLLAPWIGGLTIAKYLEAASFGGLGFLAIALTLPVVLLGWLYGGLVVAMGLLGERFYVSFRGREAPAD